nr:GLUG motif-containing protein [uncultured Cohaesibacter sp.]
MLVREIVLCPKSSSNTKISKGLLVSLLASTSLALNTVAFAGALPVGANVAAGKVRVSTSGSAMTITQGTDKAIVNWNGFSIGQNNSVEFVQPSRSSAILNRVTGTTSSTIAGSLSANGQVYLINPNGIAITSTGTVKVGGGFVASTLDILDDDFLDGTLSFSGDGSSAGVTNEGIITIGRGGYAALMGGTVKNDGLIAVPLGSIGLGSGEQATLDLSGDGFMQVSVPTADGAEGDGALVENSGSISANGGTVVMKAATARNTARQAINMDGFVEANTVSGRDGAITFGGGAGGTVKVSGTVKATAKAETGGSIEITGNEVALSGATIDASGAAGGGSVKIGGDWHGEGDVQTASTTTVDENTSISADATVDGDGGDIVVWSNDLTSFSGTISALGAGSGDGGDAEVSGKAVLDYQGFADLSSENGAYGTLLLDPYNITITDDASAGSSFTASEDDSTLSVDTLESALASANVVVSTGSEGTQDGNITVASDVSWSADTRLTLNAENNIYINADITASGDAASLSMNYGGDYSIGTGASITLSGANASLYLKGTAYTLIHSLEDLDNIDNTGLSGRYALAEDLDATDETYDNSLVGENYGTFTGTFAGLGHTISNLTIDAENRSYVGLFYFTSGATIRDFGLVGGTISAYGYGGGLVGWASYGTISNSYVTSAINSGEHSGGLVGYAIGVTISNSYATGDVTGANYTGGLVGYAKGATITDSYATGDVTGADYTGGLVGYASNGTITDSYATGDVTSSDAQVGGLVGQSNGIITGSYATGNVTGGYQVGGLVGRHGVETISDSYATGTVTATSDYIGGLVGFEAGGTIETSFANGDVSGGDLVGGLVGFFSNNGSIDRSYATGDVSGVKDVGGLVGNVSVSTISNSYATGDVDGTEEVGGLIGYVYGEDSIISYTYATGDVDGTTNVGGLVGEAYYYSPISYSYASGAVTGTENVGGLVGELSQSTLSYSYWDMDTTGQSGAFGEQIYGTVTSVYGLTTAEARASANYDEWDFTNTWYQTGDMRPILRAEANEASDGVITIANMHQMALINEDLTADYLVTVDIDASETGEGDDSSSVWGSEGFVSVGTSSSNAFSGTFDGGGHTISDLTINAGSSNTVGLFGYSTGTISNIGLIDASVKGMYTVGTLVGYSTGGDIINSYATGSVTGYQNVGGLVGYFVNGNVSNSYADVTVTATDFYGGGLVGYNQISTISQSYASGDVTGGSSLGGLVGTSDTGTISQSYASGDVTGEYDVGGLVGYATGIGTIKNSYASGSVTATDSYGSAGGLVGTLWSDAVIQTSYAVGSVSNTSTPTAAGGLVGTLHGGTIRDSVWDKETTGQSSFVGLLYSGTTAGIVGLTTSEFQDTASFMTSAANWDFNSVWAPSSSGYYPELYALTPVVWVSEMATTGIYGNSTGTGSVKTSAGGSDSYVFDDENDSLKFDSYEAAIDSTASVGTTETTLTTENSTAKSSNGISYRVFYYGSNEETITPRAITVSANDVSRSYGDGNGTLSYTVGGLGLVNGDTLTGKLSSTADSTSGVGDYAIKQGSLEASSNYSVTYSEGTLTVTPRAITVTADGLTRAYGDGNGTLTYTVGGNGLVNGDTLTGSLQTSANITSDVGEYDIEKGSVLASSNYELSFVTGTLTIRQRAITITADDQQHTYGERNDALSFSIGGEGRVKGDRFSVTLTTYGGSVADVGTYSIDLVDQSFSSNYSVTYISGTVTITPRVITITADDKSRTYGEDNGTLTYTIGGAGLVSWDRLSGSLSTTADSSSDVGTYSIDQGSLAASSNYQVESYTAGTLTVVASSVEPGKDNGGGSDEAFVSEITPWAGIIPHFDTSMSGPSGPSHQQGFAIQLNGASEGGEQGGRTSDAGSSGDDFEADSDRSFGESAVCLISAGCRIN